MFKARTIFRFAIALLLIGVGLSESNAQRNKRGQDAAQAPKQGTAQDQRGTEKAPLGGAFVRTDVVVRRYFLWPRLLSPPLLP